MATYQGNAQDLLNDFIGKIRVYLAQHQIENPCVVGVQRSGIWLSQQVSHALEASESGEINVSFYRDDLMRSGLPVQTQASLLPFSLEDRHILLVDDVLHSGRTVRAAMNELFDYGRPASIILAVLISRQGRELPIEAQISALYEEPGKDLTYHISGPDPFMIELLPK